MLNFSLLRLRRAGARVIGNYITNIYFIAFHYSNSEYLYYREENLGEEYDSCQYLHPYFEDSSKPTLRCLLPCDRNTSISSTDVFNFCKKVSQEDKEDELQELKETSKSKPKFNDIFSPPDDSFIFVPKYKTTIPATAIPNPDEDDEIDVTTIPESQELNWDLTTIPETQEFIPDEQFIGEIDITTCQEVVETTTGTEEEETKRKSQQYFTESQELKRKKEEEEKELQTRKDQQEKDIQTRKEKEEKVYQQNTQR